MPEKQFLDSGGTELKRYLKGHSIEPAWLEKTETFQGRGLQLTFKIWTKSATEAMAALSLLLLVDRFVY